ncbi:MAG: riboflavin biosynthesis protein RibF, partial [Thermoflexaceae bacterium]|nr:riboflavin biosynthesis protein RibF [Thermoflexaceae bacterium]
MLLINCSRDAVMKNNTVVVIGKFDGVHLGHRLLFERAVREAEKRQCQSAAFTFDRNLSGSKVISTSEEKRSLIEDSGIDVLIEYPFTEIMSMEAEAFVREILVKNLRARAIVAGNDCGFGKNRSGNAELLLKLSRELGFEAIILDKITVNGQTVSSTLARSLIEEGRMEEASAILGHEFFMRGFVVKGNQLGRTWDFPTINMLPDEHKIMPPNGVYASKVLLEGIWREGVTNIGRKPTVDSHNEIVSVETYIFDYDGDLYGKSLDVRLYH